MELSLNKVSPHINNDSFPGSPMHEHIDLPIRRTQSDPIQSKLGNTSVYDPY